MEKVVLGRATAGWNKTGLDGCSPERLCLVVMQLQPGTVLRQLFSCGSASSSTPTAEETASERLSDLLKVAQLMCDRF